MRKQTDFVVRVFPLGNGANDSVTGDELSRIIRNQYLANGYEVFSTAALQVSAGVIFYNVSLVKYEDAPLTPVESVIPSVVKPAK